MEENIVGNQLRELRGHTLQEYIIFAIVLTIVIIVLYLPCFLILKKRGIGIIRQSSYLALLFSVLFIGFTTIVLFNLPIDFKPKQYILNIQPFQWLWEENIKQRIMTEIRPNIMIFIPLGIFIPIVFEKTRKLYKTALIVFLVTFSIEFFQYFIGRSSDVDDLIANLLGGIIGYGMFKVFNYLFKDKKCWDKFIGKI